MPGRIFPVSGGACILFALMLLVLPLKWILAAILAAAFHELCHAVAVWLCGGRILNLKISIQGAVMTVSTMSYGKELVCALAGPVGGLLLIFVARWFPRMAICGVIQSAYNLLPLYPLDGGRMIYNAIYLLFSPRTANRIFAILQKFIAVVIATAFILGGAIWNLGVLPLTFGVFVLIRAKSGKIPCKVCEQRVQ